jgi:hypothetical protein
MLNNALDPDWQFCENCGKRVSAPPAVPAVNYPPARPQAARPPTPHPAARKQQRPTWLIPAGIGCLVLLCIGALAVGGFIYFSNRDSGSQDAAVPISSPPIPAAPDVSAPTEIPVEEPATGEPIVGPTAMPLPTTQAEEPAAPTEEPVAPTEEPVAPPSQGIVSVQQSFTRWLLDYSLQWELGETDVYITDINQDQSWIIGIKTPNSLVAVIPPDPLAYYPRNVNVTVKVKPGDYAAAGPYGLICHFQDENNYYAVEIQGDSYGIGKMVNGNFSPLTDPYWQKSQFIGQRDANDFVELGVACVDYSIGVSINGLGETYPISDPAESFSGGAVALFGASSQEAVDMLMGIFYFKDLVIEEIY